MKLGFNALCFAGSTFEQVVEFASKNGFSSIELTCTPASYPGVHHLDIEDITPEKAEKINSYLKEKGVEISCLAHYANPLAGEKERKDFVDYFTMLIDKAEILSVKNISTFTGFSPANSISKNLDEFSELFTPLLDYAGKSGVNILLENTPLMGGQRYGGNFACSPELWDSIFTKVPHKALGLNYDPSHLFWLGIDYLLFLKVFSERIHHVQAKDSEILIERLRMTGIFGNNWFRYRLPGSGSIDWRRLISALYEAGYDSYLSIELEDPVWLGDENGISRGILLGKKFMENLIV